MKGGSEDLVKYRISRSLETLREADAMIQNGFWNASVNRIYYACYYAVSGLLLKKNIETNSHKGIRQIRTSFCSIGNCFKRRWPFLFGSI
jgi:uncharacterized protein (UPF0332 family)